MNQEYQNLKFDRPKHEKDDGHAHIKFGEDPKPNLQKYGYCVVENVLTPYECHETIDKMWFWLEGLGTGIKRDDKTTWNNDNWVMNLHQGMIQHTLGQEEFMWKTREHLNILYVFYQIYNTFELLTSFDAATICRPPETGFARSPTTSWLHTDQKIVPVKLDKVYTSKYYSIQGAVNLEESDDNDAGFFVGEGSHLLHTKMFKNNKIIPKENWYLITKNDLDYLQENNIKFYKVNATKGSLILFDSRAIHSGFPHQNNRKDPDRFRYVIYVSLTPANRATQKDIDKKIKAIKEGKMTTHWSSCNIKIFPLPRTYGKDYPYLTRKENIPKWENWSDDRKKLAGLILYPK
jgi:hypothetical protein